MKRRWFLTTLLAAPLAPIAANLTMDMANPTSNLKAEMERVWRDCINSEVTSGWVVKEATIVSVGEA